MMLAHSHTAPALAVDPHSLDWLDQLSPDGKADFLRRMEAQVKDTPEGHQVFRALKMLVTTEPGIRRAILNEVSSMRYFLRQ